MTTAVISAAAVGGAVLTGCAGSGSRPAASPTATRTVTRAVTTPGPTVTKTVYRPSPAPPGSSTPAPAPGANHVIARFSGTGTQNTPPFTTPSRWHLSWAYRDCPAGTSNFIVQEYNTDGTADPSGITINELGKGRGPTATYAYGDAGSHYLSVNTEGCHWSLVPVTG